MSKAPPIDVVELAAEGRRGRWRLEELGLEESNRENEDSLWLWMLLSLAARGEDKLSSEIRGVVEEDMVIWILILRPRRPRQGCHQGGGGHSAAVTGRT